MTQELSKLIPLKLIFLIKILKICQITFITLTCHQCNSFKTTRDFFCQDLKFLTVGALMFQDQLNPIWYNVWLDPNLRNKTTNLPLELHLLLQYSYVCIRHDSCIQCIPKGMLQHKLHDLCR